jgi:hypothetical protein
MHCWWRSTTTSGCHGQNPTGSFSPSLGHSPYGDKPDTRTKVVAVAGSLTAVFLGVVVTKNYYNSRENGHMGHEKIRRSSRTVEHVVEKYVH